MTKLEMMSIISSVLFSLVVYYILSHLLVTETVTIPISILIFTLLFGLTRYYCISRKYGNILTSSKSYENGIQNHKEGEEYQAGSNLLFVAIFLVLIITCAFNSDENFGVFLPWDKFSGIDIFQLGAAIALSFFVPGFALVLVLTKNHKLNLVFKVLLGYIFSILITGLTVFFSSLYLDSNGSENNIILTGLYLAIIILFIIHHRIYRTLVNPDTPKMLYHLFSNLGNKLPKQIEANSSELIVLGSLVGLLIISTYCEYGGVTIGDQWFHQGRALLFLSGNFKEVTLSDGDISYPPVQSALIAGLTSLSGTALVNAYASIAILNMTALFAFYYFCTTWFPANMKRAALMASTLFLLGSGFGWIYILYSAVSSPANSPESSIALFTQDRIENTDITLSANYMIAAFPDFSTALIYVSLTAGFLLLGLVRTEIKNRYIYTATVSILASAGLLFHGEFYIFIAISCIAPLAFNMKNRNHIFLGLLISLVSIQILDAILPVKYFTLNEILGVPLITINIIFVAITWALYAVQQNLRRYPRQAFSLFEHVKIKVYRGNRMTLIPKIVVVWLVIYLWAISFVIWASIPTSYMLSHTSEYTTPWYLYPMRLGIIGLFGLAYVLSYLFKRFEKEVFIFGILALLAFVAGPYYNEHRFSKYVMVGFIGLASLLIFELLSLVANERPSILAIVVGSIVITGSLSTFMFVGYISVEVDSHLFTQGFSKRDFPSAVDIGMLELIRSKLNIGTNTYNIAGFPFEYYSYGVMNKFQAFAGLPLGRIAQSPLTLNSSTLELFYHLLDTSNTKFIAISKNSLDVKKIPEPIRFALNNFQNVYENNNYLILGVPTLRGPTTADSETSIAFVKDKSPIIDSIANMQFNNTKFHLENSTLKSINLQYNNQSTTSDYSENITSKNEWAKNPYSNNTDKANFFQAKFRIFPQYTGNGSINWIEGNTMYAIRYTNAGLELRQGIVGKNYTSLLFQDAEQYSKKGAWYFLTVASLNDSIDVYVNDVRKIHVLKSVPDQGPDISSVTIVDGRPAVDLRLIEVGKILSSSQLYDKKNNYDYYYPLSLLALSQTKYSSFSEDDNAVFGKRRIILPFDPIDWTDSKFKNYLEYAKSGGKLIVMKSDTNFDGRFSKLLSVVPRGNTTTDFTKLSEENGMQILNISGMMRNAEIKPSVDTRTLASYRNNVNDVIAPLVIEKKFPSGGKIILVNGKGYFDAIYSNPKKYFLTLQNITRLFPISQDITFVSQGKVEPVKRFIGNLNFKGNATITSSSFSLVDGSSNSSVLNSRGIWLLYDDKKMNKYFKNVPIVNIKLSGKYKVSIDTLGRIKLPLENSQLDYIQARIPNGFNMTIKLLNNKSSAEILTKTNSSLSSFKVSNDSRIKFYKMRPAVGLPNSVDILIKSPEILINGNTSFDGASFDGELPTTNPPLDVVGQVKANLSFVDNYKVKAFEKSGIRGQYITYIDSVIIDGKTYGEKTRIIPGDIDAIAKEKGLTSPLLKIFNSSINFLILVISLIIAITASIVFNRRHFAIT